MCTMQYLRHSQNKQLNQCRNVIENSFEILKKGFRKLLLKIKLHILILPDVVVCCCIIYNMILEVQDFNLETLTIQLELRNKINVNDVPSGRKSNGRVPMGQTPTMKLTENCKKFRDSSDNHS